MERVISASLKDALEQNRSALNTLFEYRSSVSSGSDIDDIQSMFYRMIAPVYQNGFNISDDMLCGIFGDLLTLAGRGYIGKGGRYSSIDTAFFRLLEAYPQLLSKERHFALSLFNALYNIYLKGVTPMNAWCDRMILFAGEKDYKSFMRRGFILSWRFGMARFREPAVDEAGRLGADEIRIIFDLEKEIDPGEFISSIRKDPWCKSPGADRETGPMFQYSGGFSGYSGRFRSVPGVFAIDDSIFASDGGDVYRIYADTYGVELVREPEADSGCGAVSKPGTVYGKTSEIIRNGKSYPLPDWCAGDVRSTASAGSTVAWTMVNSYRVYIAGFPVNG